MSSPYLPDQPLPASVGGFLATHLESAIAHFRSWGVRINQRSRLPLAVSLLQDIGTKERYPDSDEELVRVANALRAAFDFRIVAGALEKQRSAPLAEMLQRACGGTLEDQGPTAAHRAQSELRFGATLAAGALLPKVPPTGTTKTPDFVVSLSGLDFGVEIKRPESGDTIHDRLDDAAKQLRDFGSRYQVIVLDLSDGVCPAIEIVSDRQALAIAENAVRSRFRELCTEASDYMSAPRNRDRFDRVLLFAASVQSFVWLRETTIMPIGLMVAYPEVFHWACAGLLVEVGRDLRKRIASGWEYYGSQLRHQEPP